MSTTATSALHQFSGSLFVSETDRIPSHPNDTCLGGIRGAYPQAIGVPKMSDQRGQQCCWRCLRIRKCQGCGCSAETSMGFAS